MLYQAIGRPENKYPSLTDMKKCIDPLACKLKLEGKGSINVQPDIAIVVLGVVTENEQLKTAQTENAVKINNIIKTLIQMGISQNSIQTQSYNINPQYDYVDGKQIFRGYRVSHILKITTNDLGRVGEIVDEAVKSGANQVNNISFSLSNPSKYYGQALNAAINDALSKSQVIANKLNIAVSNVPVQIIEQNYQAKGPEPFLMLQSTDTSTQIQTGEIEIAAVIEAVFTYTSYI